MLYPWNIGGITSGIPVEYQWYTSGISVVLPVVSCGIYQWNIGGTTSGIPVEYQWYTSGISVVKFGGITTLLSLFV